MADATLRVEGLDTLLVKLNSAMADSTLRPPMQRATARLQRFIAKYPPPPPASTYVRTGTLGRSWTTEVRGFAGSLQGIIGNVVQYAPYVQDRERQAWMHAGRWQTTEDAIKQELPTIEADFGRAVEGALSR